MQIPEVTSKCKHQDSYGAPPGRLPLRRQAEALALGLASLLLLNMCVRAATARTEQDAPRPLSIHEALEVLGPLGGRSMEGTRVWLLGAETHRLLLLEFGEAHAVRIAGDFQLRGLSDDSTLRGLAVLPNGPILTIKDRRELLKIDRALGTVEPVTRLRRPAFGLWNWGKTVVLNPAYPMMSNGGGMLRARSGNEWKRFSNWRYRDSKSALRSLIINQVACGLPFTGGRFCWRLIEPQELRVIADDGEETPFTLSDSGGSLAELQLGPVGPAQTVIRDVAPTPQGGAVVLRVHGKRISLAKLESAGFESSDLGWYGQKGDLEATRQLQPNGVRLLHVDEDGAVAVLSRERTIVIVRKP